MDVEQWVLANAEPLAAVHRIGAEPPQQLPMAEAMSRALLGMAVDALCDKNLSTAGGFAQRAALLRGYAWRRADMPARTHAGSAAPRA